MNLIIFINSFIVHDKKNKFSKIPLFLPRPKREKSRKIRLPLGIGQNSFDEYQFLSYTLKQHT